MLFLQVMADGLLLGGLYASIAAGFSLVWGVLNIINLMHGSFIVLGAYLAYFANQRFGINPFLFFPVAGAALFVIGFVIQRLVLNRVIGKTVLITLTLTFGLDLVLSDLMLQAFGADYRKLVLHPSLGLLDLHFVVIPLDRLFATAASLAATCLLWILLRSTRLGRAIVAVRMDAGAASLMGVRAEAVYAVTFGIAAAMAGLSGSLLAAIFPISPLMSGAYLAKSFVICVLGGLGSVPGVIVAGLLLGMIESISSIVVGPNFSTTISFVLLLSLLFFRPNGLFGRRGFE